MTLTAHDEDAIMKRVSKRLPVLRAQMARMHPAEAMALLGDLTTRAFLRFPPQERMHLCDAWLAALRDSVRGSLD